MISFDVTSVKTPSAIMSLSSLASSPFGNATLTITLVSMTALSTGTPFCPNRGYRLIDHLIDFLLRIIFGPFCQLIRDLPEPLRPGPLGLWFHHLLNLMFHNNPLQYPFNCLPFIFMQSGHH